MRCGWCQFENPTQAVFCMNCGTRIGSPPHAPSPRSYTPRHLAAKIVASKAAIEGERKVVTVLFADLKSSLELIAGRDPEDARALLDPVLEQMMDAVHRYEGTVNQVMGDGIMALFGAPVAHEDHALRACHAALRMRDSIRQYARAASSAHGVEVAIRVGLNSGEVVVRSISTELHMDYSAIGQTTHLAARLEQLAAPGSILITAQTARLVDGHVRLEARGPAELKGLAAPIAVFELLGSGPARSRVQAGAELGLTPFVGREQQMDTLAAAVARVEGGQCAIVAIEGDAGVGKSRLLWEFLRTPRAAALRVASAYALSYGSDTAWLPIVTLLKNYFGILPGDDDPRAAEKVRAALADESAPGLVTPLLALLDLPLDDARWMTFEPEARRRRMVEATRRLFQRHGEREPIGIVIEDLHWVDAETEAMLDALVDGLTAARVLILVSYRPEYQDRWTARSGHTSIRLDPLSRSDARSLLDGLVGKDALLDPIKELLVERTEGNAFFLEESVRNLVETGALAGLPGDYRLVRAPGQPRVPETIQSVLAARVDRVPGDDKQVLQAASAIGRDVPLALLEAVTAMPRRALDDSVRRLQEGGFLREVRLDPEAEYAFKHALTVDVVYGQLLRARRLALDAAIVEATERLHGERAAGHVERLARHALRGELWEKAVAHCREAGRRTFRRSAHRGAVTYFENALHALAQLPETPARTTDAIDVRLDLRYALSPLGDSRRILTYLREAETLAASVHDERRLGLVSALLTYHSAVGIDLRGALEHGRRAVRIAHAVRDPGVSVLATTFLGLAYYALGDFSRAIRLGRKSVDAVRGIADEDRLGLAVLPAVYTRSILAWSLAETGAFAEGFGAAREALVTAGRQDDAYSSVYALLATGALHLWQGASPDAIAALERARAISTSERIMSVATTVASRLASAYCQAGRVTDAIRTLEEAIEQAIAIGDRFGVWLQTFGLGEAYLHARRFEEALPLVQRSLELSRIAGGRATEARALLLVAEATAATRSEPRDETAARYAAARDLSDRLGMRPLRAQAELALGRFLQSPGDAEGARSALEAARDGFVELGMTTWADRAAAALAGGVP